MECVLQSNGGEFEVSQGLADLMEARGMIYRCIEDHPKDVAFYHFSTQFENFVTKGFTDGFHS